MQRPRVILRALLGALIVVALVPASAFGIDRDTVLARGKVWVDKNVPYSQTRWARVSGTLIPTSTPVATAQTQGYRTDCSGFVSMCLGLTNSRGLPLSLTTRSFYPSTVTAITKSALLPGDVMLKIGTHVVLFAGWSDDNRTTFKAYEERGTAYGCVQTTRNYAEMYKWGYRAYRYRKIDDSYIDCQEPVYGSTRYETAVAASRLAFPETNSTTVKALVLTNGESWTGNLAGAALAGAAGGPLLLSTRTSLPATTTAAIKRLKPERVYVIGGSPSVSTTITAKIAALGPTITRVVGVDRYVTTAKAAETAVALARGSGRTVDAVYLVGTDSFGDGVAVSPVAAKTARPILLTRRTSIPRATLDALKNTGIKRIYIIGNTNSVSSAVFDSLKKRGFSVARRGGVNRYATSLSVARHAVGIAGSGLSWSRIGVGSGEVLDGALAYAVAQGESGSLLLLTPGTNLYSDTAAEIAEQHAGITKVRVFGSYNTIGLPVRTSIAKVMRAQ